GADVRRRRCAVSHNSCSLASNEHLALTCGIISLIQLRPYYLQFRSLHHYQNDKGYKSVLCNSYGADVRRRRCAVSHNSCSLASNEPLGVTCGIISLIQLPPHYLQFRSYGVYQTLPNLQL
ncbi:hypothetical protein J6590_078458, partial [Homalodisca vitripennis]